MKVFRLSYALLLALGSSSLSWASSGNESAAFLGIPVGAGPASLGGAYSTLATDAYAPVWNPAGLGCLPSTQIAAQHLSYLESIYYEYASGVLRLKDGRGLGFSAQYLGSGDIPGSTYEGAVAPDYSVHYGAYSLAYGQTIGTRLSLGFTGKWINAKISDVSSNAFAADAGALYKVNEKATLSATLRNLGNKLKFLNDNSSLPLSGRLGGALRPSRQWLMSVEGDFPKDGSASAHVGVQWSPLDLLSIRAGYRTDTTKELDALAGFSTGIGLNLWGQEFSYAWVPYGDLGNTQYFSLLLRFGQSDEEKRNLIRGQDIKRHRNAGTEQDDIEGQQLIELFKSDEEKTAQKSMNRGSSK